MEGILHGFYLRFGDLHLFQCPRKENIQRATSIPSTRPGRFPIIVEPTINNCKVNRVLIDGGSSLNVLFMGALEEMQIPKSKVKPVKYAFHGIVPGSTAKPIG